MQKLLYVIVGVIVLCAVARIAVGFISAKRVATGLTDGDGSLPMLASCADLQNCTSSTSTNKQNQVAPISYQSASTDVIEKIANVIRSQSGAKIEVERADYLHATYKTTLMGYTDDLELLIDEATGVLNIRSASRIGVSDLGANRKRIEALRVSLADIKL